MKTKVASLLAVFFMIAAQSMAQQTITVEAQNSDISNNLDLQAVASAFGESTDLEDFERRLNDYDSQISNLDLNNDGEVDYLRVIESAENNVHVVVIQAVLDRDVFQDVATIVVDKKNDRRTYVQVVGDPYLFGDNYIIEPVYVYTPSIFSFFWGPRYRAWYSPYYWGYYPSYYRYRRPFALDIYLSHIQMHINHNYRYYYTNRWRNEHAERIYNSMGRHDYAHRYPDRTFVRRNENIRNKNEFNSRQSLPSRPDYRNSENARRSPGFDNSSRGNVNSGRENVNSGRTRNDSPTWTGGTPQRSSSSNNNMERNSNRTVTRSYDSNNGNINRSETTTRSRTYSSPEVNRNSSNGSYQRQTNTTVTRPSSTVTRERTVSRPSVNSQPNRSTSEPRQVQRQQQVQHQENVSRSREVKAENRSSNSEKENKRR